MLTVYFGLNLILNYSWLFGISMLKGSFDGKNPKFFMKKKTLYGPFLWMGFNCLKARATSRRQFRDQQSTKNYCSFKCLCFKSSRCFAAKTKLDTSPSSLWRSGMEKW